MLLGNGGGGGAGTGLAGGSFAGVGRTITGSGGGAAASAGFGAGFGSAAGTGAIGACASSPPVGLTGGAAAVAVPFAVGRSPIGAGGGRNSGGNCPVCTPSRTFGDRATTRGTGVPEAWLQSTH